MDLPEPVKDVAQDRNNFNIWATLERFRKLLFTGKTAAPGVTDDRRYGIDVGTIWIDEAGDNAYLCVDNTYGAAVWNNFSTSGAVLPAPGSAGKILRSTGAAWANSTSTFADTYSVSTILYASSANTVTGLATAASGVLVTSAGGVPSIATDIPTAVTIGSAYIYRAGGTDVPLADGGTNASLTASNGGIFYSTATAGAILSGTATAGLALVSGASTTPSWFAPTAGSVIFAGTDGVLSQDNANFFWNDGSDQLQVSKVVAGTGLLPDADDGAYLGQSGTAFSDLYLASGALIDFAAGDVTLTHSLNTLAFTGATSYTFDAVVSGITPTASNHLVTKEYVDSAMNFTAEYYFNNTASSIGGIYYKMLETPTGEGQADFTGASPYGVGDDQAHTNFATDAGIPGVNTLQAGIYAGHIHASRAVGNKPVKIHFDIYSRTTGGVETLIATSEESDFLGTSSAEYTLHAVLTTDVSIDTTDRVIVKWLVNVDAGGTDATVTLSVEGATSAHLNVPVSTEVLSSVFVRQDGTKALTANWNAGAFTITANTFTANTGLMPDANDGAYLGQSGTAFSDLFLASGAVIDFNAGDVTLTHTANTLTVGGGDLALGSNNITITGSLAATGARCSHGWFTDLTVTNAISGSITGNAATVTVIDSTDTTCWVAIFDDQTGSLAVKTDGGLTYNASTGILTATGFSGPLNGTVGATTPATVVGTTITANTGLMPDADDGAYIGQSGTAFSDLFLASGAVINFAAGDVTITHAANALNIDGGNIGLGTAPDVKFHVAVGSQIGGSFGDAATAIKISGTADSSSVWGGIVWDMTGTNGGVNEQFGIYGWTASSTDRLTITYDRTSLVTIYDNGKVGIGDTTPEATLDITQAAASSGSPIALQVSGGAHTTLANALAYDIHFDLNRTVTFTGGGGAFAQATTHFEGVTYDAGSAQSFSALYGVEIDAPSTTTNITLAGAQHALVVPGVGFNVNSAGGTSSAVTGLRIGGVTATLLGSTTPFGPAGSPGFAGISVGQWTISSAAAITVTNAASVYIAAAPAAGGAGPVTITNAYALWVDAGDVRLDGNLYLQTTGSKIDFNAGDVTVTHSANTLAFSGASSGYTFDATITDTAGINFGQTTLTNYTEGTFTPTVTLVGGAGNTTPVYTTNTGRYVRVGRTVFFTVYLNGDGGNEGAGTGQVNIALPVTASASAAETTIHGLATNGSYSYHIIATIAASGTTMTLQYLYVTSLSGSGDTLDFTFTLDTSTLAATTNELALGTFQGSLQSSTTRSIKISGFYEV